MAQPRPERIFTAIDIGSAKVSAMIAAEDDKGKLRVLGTGQRQSRGIKRGFVAELDQTEQAVREAIEQAERIAGLNIDDVWVSYTAGNMTSDIVRVETELGDSRVEREDVVDLLASGRASIDPVGRTVLHAQPALFTLDGMEGVRDPVGLNADRLGVDIHVVLADAAPLRNLERCVRAAHLNVKAIVAAPLATGLACLTPEERDIGVALVEIGGAVTTVSLFAGGMIVALRTLPFGASEITDDVAGAFGVRRSQAERLKCFYGSAMASPRDNHDMIDLDEEGEGAGKGQRRQISRAQLISVIRQRLDHMTDEISKTLKAMGFLGPVGRQVILTGGGAELKGMADYAQGALGRSVRTGRPRGIASMPEAHAGPAFATLAGLIVYAASGPIDLRKMAPGGPDQPPEGGAVALVARLFKTLRRNF